MLLLLVSAFTAVRKIQANVRMILVILKWAFLYGPTVRRCIIYAQDGPTLEVFAAVISRSPSDIRERHHLPTPRVIHAIHGNSIIIGAYKKHLGDRPGLPGVLGTCPGVHAPTEALGLGQGRNLPIQGIGRGVILPERVVVYARSRPVVPRRRRGAGTRSSREATSSSLRLLRHPAKSTAQLEPPET